MRILAVHKAALGAHLHVYYILAVHRASAGPHLHSYWFSDGRFCPSHVAAHCLS